MTERTMGWREWIALPDLGAVEIKAKVDTGAASSSLHAFGLSRFSSNGRMMVRFAIHPRQRSRENSVTVDAEIVDERRVRNPGGRTEIRPVILVRLSWADVSWDAEINLTRRDEMGFRMLLGRKALNQRFVVDPGRSFLGGRPEARA
jgi:hypothetical protein